MAKLIDCAECGKKVSENALKCPHCGTVHIKKKKCVVCHKSSKFSSMVSLSQRGVIGYGGNYFVSKLPINPRLAPMAGVVHSDCLSHVHPIYRNQASTTKVTKKCPTCETKLQQSLLALTEKGDYQESVECHSCGEGVYMNLHDGSHRPCYYCGLLLDTTDESKAIRINDDDFSHLYCYRHRTDGKRNPAWINLPLLALLAFGLVIWLQ